MSKSKKKTSGFAIALRVIGLVMIIPICLFIYNFFFVEQPQTVGSTVVNGLGSPETPIEDTTTFLNVQYLKNTDGSGQPLFEVGFNSQMTATDTKNIKTQGIQIHGELNKTNWHAVESEEKTGFLRTDATHYASWDITNKTYFDSSTIGDHVTTVLSMNNMSNDTTFMLSVNQTNEETGEITTTPISLQFKKAHKSENMYIGEVHNWLFWNFYEETYTYAGLNNFLISLQESCESLDVGTHFLYMDLSNWFDVFLWDDKDQDYTRLTADIQYTYILMKVNISNTGAVKNEQSMFGLLAQEDGTFEFDSTDSAPFWKYINNYTIANKDFTPIEDYSVNGYMLMLDAELVDYLKGFEDLRIKIEINLSDFNKNITSISCLSLGNLKYYSITITSDTAQDITLSFSEKLQVDTIYHNSNVNVLFDTDKDFNVEVA